MLILRIIFIIATIIFLWGAIAEYKSENFYKLIGGVIVSVFAVALTYIFR